MAGSPFRGAEVVWRVLPLASPRVLRHCVGCETTRPFASTEKFRLNAQQRHVDVWLLYACTDCDHTWKREIVQRRSPAEIGPDLYARFLRNDPETAWRYACAPGERTDDGAAGARVEPLPAGPLPPPPVRIVFEVPFPCGVRLDRLLAAEAGCSRGALQRAVESGAIEVIPGGARALRRPPRHGLTVVVHCGRDENEAGGAQP